MRTPRFPIALALTLAAGSAVAHPGHEAAGFVAGFAHPLGGVDHLLAMLAVGLYAARQDGAGRWAVPASFLLAMLAGAALAAAGLPLPGVEAGIAVSLLVLGLLVGALARLPVASSAALVASFALFHGHAHGAEMGAGGIASYAAGFLLATGLLHGAGYGLARWLPETSGAALLRRVVGGLIAGAGVFLLGA